MPDLSTVARTFADSFRRDTRPDGTSYTTTKTDAPAWVTDVIMEAHGDMLPDDWRYDCIASAGRAIVEAIDYGTDQTDAAHDFADGYVDVYNAARIAWLGSHTSRPGYADEAYDELGGGADLDTMERIGLGQYAEAEEVYNLVLGALQDLADEDDE